MKIHISWSNALFVVCNLTASSWTRWFVLYCTFSSPVPELRWSKYLEPLPASAEISMSGAVLKIFNIQYEDEGLYECEAENYKGKDKHQARVYVQGRKNSFTLIDDLCCFHLCWKYLCFHSCVDSYYHSHTVLFKLIEQHQNSCIKCQAWYSVITEKLLNLSGYDCWYIHSNRSVLIYSCIM